MYSVEMDAADREGEIAEALEDQWIDKYFNNARKGQAISLEHPINLVMGDSRSGKTWGLMHDAIMHGIQNPGIDIAFVCLNAAKAYNGGGWSRDGFVQYAGDVLCGNRRTDGINQTLPGGLKNILQLHNGAFIHIFDYIDSNVSEATGMESIYFDDLDVLPVAGKFWLFAMMGLSIENTKKVVAAVRDPQSECAEGISKMDEAYTSIVE